MKGHNKMELDPAYVISWDRKENQIQTAHAHLMHS